MSTVPALEKILVVDNDEGLAHFLTRLFERQGFEVEACLDGPSALERLTSGSFDLILLDYKMPGLSGLETLAEIKRALIKTPVIIMTAHGTTETAIEAMKAGAYDYLLKPFDTEELKRIAGEALRVNRLMKEVVSLPGTVTRVAAPEATGVRIVGSHRKMQEVFKLIGQVAGKDVTVLISGESGTGKELVARAIYHHSHRKNRPFMAINCATIPDALFESELFGHERGAFTGAHGTYLGKFERCHTGTLFFDEIGDISRTAQAKLLRVLQEGEYERLGGTETIHVDVRVLAATNKNLEKEVEEGRFREDLYYRLKVISIDLPPLRERLDDVAPLIEYFVSRFAGQYEKPIQYIAEPTIRKLCTHSWPGNVRELENALRRAVLICKGDVLLPEHLHFEVDAERAAAATCEDLVAGLKQHVAELVPQILRMADQQVHANLIELVEETLIGQALRVCGFNQVRTARMLGLSRNTLRHRIRKYGLECPEP